jgi:N-acetylmuramoyl-L-alanine amidase
MAATRASTDFVFVHHTNSTEDIGLAEITRQHRAKGMMACGFHYIVCRDGRVQVGRHLDQCGNHAPGFNDKSLGICVVGIRGSEPKAQAKALGTLLANIRKQYPTAEFRLGN